MLLISVVSSASILKHFALLTFETILSNLLQSLKRQLKTKHVDLSRNILNNYTKSFMINLYSNGIALLHLSSKIDKIVTTKVFVDMTCFSYFFKIK